MKGNPSSLLSRCHKPPAAKDTAALQTSWHLLGRRLTNRHRQPLPDLVFDRYEAGCRRESKSKWPIKPARKYDAEHTCLEFDCELCIWCVSGSSNSWLQGTTSMLNFIGSATML